MRPDTSDASLLPPKQFPNHRPKIPFVIARFQLVPSFIPRFSLSLDLSHTIALLRNLALTASLVCDFLFYFILPGLFRHRPPVASLPARRRVSPTRRHTAEGNGPQRSQIPPLDSRCGGVAAIDSLRYSIRNSRSLLHQAHQARRSRPTAATAATSNQSRAATSAQPPSPTISPAAAP